MSPLLILTLLSLLLGGVLGYLASRLTTRGEGSKLSRKLSDDIARKQDEFRRLQSTLELAQSHLKVAEAEARAQAKEIVSEAKIEAQRMEAEQEKRAAHLEEQEKHAKELRQQMEEQSTHLTQREQEVGKLREELSQASEEHRHALEHVAQLSEEEAKTQLQQELAREFSGYFAAQVDRLQAEAKQQAEERARNLMAEAMHRYAAEVTAESTATIVQLPSEDMKGRIIGKEGRNISAFEHATGVDVIIDDTPGCIVISGFDLVRRYVAKRALEKLLQDGRIQPARIEEVVAKTKEEVAKMMVQFGERALQELGITGYHPELVKIIGRLRFRTSYGQNILKHSVEMAHLARILAEEVGANPQIAVEGALLHDIGKALDHEVQGTHVEIGVEICKRYKIRPEVIHCIEAHHEDVPIRTPEAFIVAAVDAISGARPGARRESLEAYIKRLKELEDVARGFSGVQKAYAISAGREVRVFVDVEKIDDLQQRVLAKDIAEKIEKELTYPGVIKVNVIRERRIEELAK